MGMFSSGKQAGDAPVPAGGLSIVAVGMTVRGDIESNGTVKVEGTVEGQIEAANQVLVAKGGVVQGDIGAREAVVGGAVHGAVQARDRVEIQAGAVVNGNITTKRIAVAEGGTLNGQIRMNEAGETKQPAKVEAKNPAAPPAPPTPGARPSVPVARVAVPPRLPTSGV